MQMRPAGVVLFRMEQRTDGRIDMTGLLVAFRNCYASRLKFKTQKGLL